MRLPTPKFRVFTRGRQGGPYGRSGESVTFQNATGQSADACSLRRCDDWDLPVGGISTTPGLTAFQSGWSGSTPSPSAATHGFTA